MSFATYAQALWIFFKKRSHCKNGLFLLFSTALYLLPFILQAATFTVNTTNDTTDDSPGDGICADASGNCSLRAAIQEANALPGADNIDLPADTYLFTLPGTDEDAAATGDLDINSDITLTGADTRTTIIHADSLDRAFDIFMDASLTISGVEIREGYVFSSIGGGIRNLGNLTMTDVHLTLNACEGDNGNMGGGGFGGGIHNANTGIVNAENCTFSYNTAQGGRGVNGDSCGGGGGGGGSGGFGGGIYNEDNGVVTLANCTLSGNEAVGGRGGNGPTNGGCFNGAGGNGGGFGGMGGDATGSPGLDGDFFSGGGGGGGTQCNPGGAGGNGGFGAGGGGGGASTCGGAGGTPGMGGFGGGNGGQGCCSEGAGGGGGAGLGGAIFNIAGEVYITSSTLAFNLATGGQRGGGAFGGGGHGQMGEGYGGGIFNESGIIEVNSTLLGANTSTTTENDIWGEIGSTTGFNLIQDIGTAMLTGTTTGNVTGTDPALEPLANNGGDTDTHALSLCNPTSPAINASDISAALPLDQRDSTRINAPDIGAYEAPDMFTFAFDIEDATLCAGESVTLDATTPGASFQWSDGSTDPTLNVSMAGIYAVSVTLAGCLQTDQVTVIATPLPMPDIGADQTICEGETVTLDASMTGATYAWQDGSMDATFLANSTGTYSVTVTVANCASSDAMNLTVNPLPIIDLGIDPILCEGESVTLDATMAGATYEWQDGSTAATFLANSTGTYAVTVTANGCSSSDMIDVTINPLPIVDLGIDQTICNGESVTLDASIAGATYAWQDGSTNATFTASQTGNYSVTVTLANCTASDAMNLTVNPLPLVDLGIDQVLCEGESTTLDATLTGASGYLWQDGSTNATFTASQTGNYSVTVTLANCTASDAMNLTVNALPVIDLGLDQAICEGESTTLDATLTGASGYLWQDGSTNATFTSSETGDYSVTVTLAGCVASGSVAVAVNPLPTVDLGADQMLCDGETLLVDATTPGATAYLWSDGSTNPQLTVSQTGNYSVVVTNGSNCQSSDDITIAPQSCECAILVPNAFSPNDDGRNDVLRPVTNCIVSAYQLQVFNRWGDAIFTTTDITDGWDGSIDKRPATLGVYVWAMTISYVQAGEVVTEIKKGNVTLVR